ncbi:MAG: SnoaL-like polyketide cyclase [Solirubrobacteraceae bacterium]|jgi:ketosteroid isomerase-like protein|nr:SnoaL-like polyketide cyclase [Solirubrobacteraceae bacterium]
MPSDAEQVRDWYGEGETLWDPEMIDRWHRDIWDPDIEWRAIPGAPDDVGPMHGRDRLRRYYEEWLEVFDEIRVEARDVIQAGEAVVVDMRVSGTSRSGVSTQIDFSIAMHVRDGRMADGREFATHDEALAAARGSG